MKIVQINSVLNVGSTGKIAEQIGEVAQVRGHTSFIAYGRQAQPSSSVVFKVGKLGDMVLHGAGSFLLDRHGLGSLRATRRLVEWLEDNQPDAIGLHNIHGYFINYPILFDYLRRSRLPVVWTLHDCWAFTGHCSHFNRFNCAKWENECFDCPMTGYYPRSLLDFSQRNFRRKRQEFNGLPRMTIVTPSEWLGEVVGRSFLSTYPVRIIKNGIDIETFKPTDQHHDEIIVLGVANTWSGSKGLEDFGKIRDRLPANFRIVLIGVTESQERALPKGIEGIRRTESVVDLASWYQRATVFANPTYSDNFPMTNLEALACGTPVVTYDVGGSAEAISESTGRAVPRGDVEGLVCAIQELARGDHRVIGNRCRIRAEKNFNRSDRFNEYIDLYESLTSDKNRYV